jgi:glycosyltransferase involved in cell wall biosynthesis
VTKICIVPRLSGVGGMVSFQGRLAAGLAQRGIELVYNLKERPLDAVLVVGGTRDLAGLRQARRDAIRVVQRLNGMNWMHRHRKTGLRHFLRSEYGNLILGLIRARLADHIVYQSHFSKGWWQRVGGATALPTSVVYNAVDLETFSPTGNAGGFEKSAPGVTRLLMVEGSLGGGYDLGLAWGVGLAERLSEMGLPTELVVAGRVTPEVKAAWTGRTKIPVKFAGLVQAADIPALDRSADLFYAADLHAACPNSVIEALACGLPVVALDSGALKELVLGESGRVTPYGGDPWKLDPPDLDTLAQAAAQVLADPARFRAGARRRAEQAFDLARMVEGYLAALQVSASLS